MRFPWQKYGWRLTVLACLVSAMHVYFLSAALIHKTYLTDDSVQYLTLSENLADSGIFSQSFSPPLVPDMQRTPGYPVFLMLLGRSPFWILLVQHLLVLAAAWFLYKAAADLYGHRVASSGAKLYLLQPYPVILASYVLSEVLFVFLLIVAVWAYLRFWKGAGWHMLAVSMGVLSLGAMVRPVALPLLVAAVLLAIVHLRRLPRQRFVQAAVATLLPVLLLGPWFLRNQQLSGRLTFSTMGEMGMLHGRLGGLQTWRSGREMHEHEFYMAGDSIAAESMGLTDLRHYPEGKQTHETEQLAGGMGGMTFQFFLRHPWDAIRFEAWAGWQMFKGVGYGWARELTLCKPVAVLAAGLQLLCNLLMFLGALLAVVRWREWTGAEGLVFGSIFLVLIISAAAWADGRYRMVIDPLILLLAMFPLRRQEKIQASTTFDAVHIQPIQS
jgi:4-amino-4-deoxy-L-arabinose transferase-like glycosyltransferase